MSPCLLNRESLNGTGWINGIPEDTMERTHLVALANEVLLHLLARIVAGTSVHALAVNADDDGLSSLAHTRTALLELEADGVRAELTHVHVLLTGNLDTSGSKVDGVGHAVRDGLSLGRAQVADSSTL